MIVFIFIIFVLEHQIIKLHLFQWRHWTLDDNSCIHISHMIKLISSKLILMDGNDPSLTRMFGILTFQCNF
jgi:hypothetical protein